MNGFEMILPFLKPIEHLILDDSISEVMVNGPDRVFIEKRASFNRCRAFPSASDPSWSP
jgi:Flp pilus assembly CpaF family ATPase